MTPFYQSTSATLYQGEALPLLATMPPASIDAVIADPPYSSGGTTAGERRMDPVDKYAHNSNACGRPTFAGDAKDQRSFTWWTMQWLSLCRPLLRDGGYVLVFTDWRQLPATTDALQAADFTWRGVIAWDKGGASRAPHKGYMRHQCEYIVWGTHGRCRVATHAGPYPGCYRIPVDQRDKHHLTGKPTALLRELVRIVPSGGVVLDPFAGSGTTLLAAQLEGRIGIGIEREPAYCEITARRLRGDVPPRPDRRVPPTLAA